MTDIKRAIGLFSGGLDSMLAVRIMQNQGFDVTAIHFYTGFNGNVHRDIRHGPGWVWEPEKSVVASAKSLGLELLPLDITDEFFEVMLNPRYGYGSAANPCIDCRIITLSHARDIMEREGAAVVFTGEVMGQRPMSQNRTMLRTVEKRSGLTGRVLRPLSAKLLDPTIPEEEGIVDREGLYDIQGRSRQRQMALADEFGIERYPTPAGGCILTDKQYGKKFNDLLAHAGTHPITLRDLRTLKTGRHLRLASGLKAVMGRRQVENEYLQELLGEDCLHFHARDYAGATVYALDKPDMADTRMLAAIAARYSKGVKEPELAVLVHRGETTEEITVAPMPQEDIEPLLTSA